MPKRLVLVVALAALILIAGVRGPGRSGVSDTLSVAAASSFRALLPDLIDEFERGHPEIKVRVTYASSGTLAAAIELGAPYDVFLSADTDRPEHLQQLGLLTEPGVRKLRATHVEFVLTSDHTGSSARRIAIPNPRFAPFGRSAKAWLETSGEPEPYSLIYADSVTHAAALLHTRAVDGAFLDPSHAERYRANDRFTVLRPAGAPTDHAGRVRHGFL